MFNRKSIHLKDLNSVLKNDVKTSPKVGPEFLKQPDRIPDQPLFKPLFLPEPPPTESNELLEVPRFLPQDNYHTRQRLCRQKSISFSGLPRITISNSRQSGSSSDVFYSNDEDSTSFINIKSESARKPMKHTVRKDLLSPPSRQDHSSFQVVDKISLPNIIRDSKSSLSTTMSRSQPNLLGSDHRQGFANSVHFDSLGEKFHSFHIGLFRQTPSPASSNKYRGSFVTLMSGQR